MTVPMRWQPRGSSECTAACASMLLAHHRRREPKKRLLRLLGITKKRGTSVKRFIRVLRELGYPEARTTRLDHETPRVPFIALVDVARLWGFDQAWRGRHVVVVTSLTQRHVIINDPWPEGGGRGIRLSRERFEHVLVRGQNNIIVVG